MPFHPGRLRQLGNCMSIPIRTDEQGLLGRECPEESCEGYFKIKPGTGLTGPGLTCTCPYCGHTAAPDHFWTKDQIEYAKSVAVRQITNALHADLKSLEFEHKPRGPFGIGVSFKVTGGHAHPIHHYREKTLETDVTCAVCTLEYAVFGVFGFCPDCAVHNSAQILERNLDLIRRQVNLASGQDDVEFRRHLLEDALENCVSAFDGFARESCRVRALASSDAERCKRLSFQNLPKASNAILQLFKVDLAAAVQPSDWMTAHRAFMQRHLLAHKAGVVDQQYLDETDDAPALLGRKVSPTCEAVLQLTDVVAGIGKSLIALLPSPPR